MIAIPLSVVLLAPEVGGEGGRERDIREEEREGGGRKEGRKGERDIYKGGREGGRREEGGEEGREKVRGTGEKEREEK